MSKLKYFPHLAGSLVLASVGIGTMLDKWEPAKDEGKDLVVYADKLARGLPTVCNGITKHVATIPVIVGEVWTKEMCEQQQEQALEKLQLELVKCFKVLPPQSVFDAATDHAWNNGYGATCSSGSMQQWNLPRWEQGCKLLAFRPNGEPNWASVKTGKILPNGKPEYRFVQGLHNRGIDRVKNCVKDIPK